MTAFMPDAQTLLTVVQMTEVGSPAPRAACLAGACMAVVLIQTSVGSNFLLVRYVVPAKGTLGDQAPVQACVAHLAYPCADSIAHQDPKAS